MFYARGAEFVACRQFSNAGATCWVRKFQAVVNWRKWPVYFAMSGLPPEADTNRKGRHVRWVPQLVMARLGGVQHDLACDVPAHQSRVPPVGQITPAVGPEPAAKIFPFCSHPNQFIPAAVPPGKRGGSRSSRNARWDAVAAMDTTDERDTLRTAKSCGPGAATLASSFTSHIVERRWQESPFTGESAK